MTHTIRIPGRFDCYFSMGSIGQGLPEQYAGTEDEELYQAAKCLSDSYRNAKYVRRGKGWTCVMEGLTEGALRLLRNHAEDCIDVNLGGDNDYAEMQAAKTVFERVNALLAKEEER